jgi:hypothetical protein
MHGLTDHEAENFERKMQEFIKNSKRDAASQADVVESQVAFVKDDEMVVKMKGAKEKDENEE